MSSRVACETYSIRYTHTFHIHTTPEQSLYLFGDCNVHYLPCNLSNIFATKVITILLDFGQFKLCRKSIFTENFVRELLLLFCHCVHRRTHSVIDKMSKQLKMFSTVGNSLNWRRTPLTMRICLKYMYCINDHKCS